MSTFLEERERLAYHRQRRDSSESQFRTLISPKKSHPQCYLSQEVTQSPISWIVVGILTFVWYWVGYKWTCLQDIPRGDWKPAWILFTLIVMVVFCCRMAEAGANVLEAVINRIKGMVPHLVGLVLALFVGVAIWSLLQG